MLPFVQTGPPARLANHPINLFGDWYRWSDDFRETLIRLSLLIPEIPSPHLINLYQGRPYDCTYTISHKLTSGNVHKEILRAVESMHRMKVGKRLFLFTELIDEDISSQTIHYLFSYYQSCFGIITGKPNNAMYAPLGDLSAQGFSFPLHADLYLQNILFIVFDNVPPDNSGHSLLLPAENFLKTISSLSTMPGEVKAHLKKLLTENILEDCFNEFFNALYVKEALWMGELAMALESQQIAVKFLRGEGFLLHDRRWLHGRTAPSHGVFVDRLHRLTFNTEEVS
jgi:hypothetical protein